MKEVIQEDIFNVLKNALSMGFCVFTFSWLHQNEFTKIIRSMNDNNTVR